MPIRILMRAVWLLLNHAGLSATTEAGQVRAWLAQHESREESPDA